jgi:glycine/D-amino acid oxidase-like deaminating enzyme
LHITSLWLRGVSLPTEAVSPLPARADVVVIGGGYTGISAARALARAGATVVVLERESPGWGASGRNGGFVLPGFKRELSAIAGKWGREAARRLFAESLESITHLESLIRVEGIACEFRRVGHVALAENPRDFAALAKERDFFQSVAGHETRLLDRADTTREIGSARYIGGLLDESAGSVHPARLLRGLAAASVRAGATIFSFTQVLKIEGSAGGFAVSTSRGTVRADQVVVATNGYTDAACADLRRRVIPIGSHIIATAPLDPLTSGRLIPRARVLSDSRRLLHYFRLSGDGRLVFGGRAAFRPARQGADPGAAAILRRDMITVFPEMASIPVEYAWSGNVAFTRDRMPHVGRFNGCFTVGGYCGHGVAMAIYLGTRVGQHLADRSELPFLASLKFPVVPLYNGSPWFLPLVGAWYQMLDWTRSRR